MAILFLYRSTDKYIPNKFSIFPFEIIFISSISRKKNNLDDLNGSVDPIRSYQILYVVTVHTGDIYECIYFVINKNKFVKLFFRKIESTEEG